MKDILFYITGAVYNFNIVTGTDILMNDTYQHTPLKGLISI